MYLYKKIFLIFILLHTFLDAYTQAGNGVYQFLNLPVSSQQMALGGNNISMYDGDVSFAMVNPALLNQQHNNVLTLNAANYLADIRFGSIAFSRTINKKSEYALGVQYINYGKFDYYDQVNNPGTGQFSANDLSLNVIYSRILTKNIRAGINLKPIASNFESYSSYGFATDLGIHFIDSTNLFSAGFVIRNLGTQLKGYYSTSNGQHLEPLPLNLMVGMTKKLSHAPFRISATLHNLQRWDLTYSSTDTIKNSIDEVNSKVDNIIDMAFRHAIVGIDFLPGKNFYLSAAYNHRRSAELKMKGFKSLSGFSFGGGIKIKQFQVGFGTTQFQVGNSAYMFSLTTHLDEFNL